MRTTVKAVSSIIVSAALAATAFAQPPAHAPAHGWRKKHDPYYVGYTGYQWERDFEISSGKCNRQEIATVVGAIDTLREKLARRPVDNASAAPLAKEAA